MNISIVATLDTRYIKKDGTSAVIIRIGRDNQTLPIPTGYSVPERYWDEKKRKVKNTYPGVTSVTRLNNQIEAEVKAVKDVALELSESGILDTLTLTDIKKRIIQEKEGSSFFTYADSVIAELEKANRIGTKNAYTDAIKALENFVGNRNLGFKQITFDLLKSFEISHLAKGNGANGLAAYMRGIRAIYNQGINAGLVAEKHYPFKKYSIKTQPTAKRAIAPDLLQRIFSLQLDELHSCFHARNYFVISYILYGMNFYDIALLKRENIVNGRICYQRSKTSRPYDIKFTPALEKLLEYYLERNTEYIFGIIKRNTPDLQDKDIKWARKRYNKKLKELAKLCGIETNLTSYVGRHSFATHARNSEIPLPAISAMLGHTSIKTTQIYLDSLPSSVLDEYNSKLQIA